MSQDAGGILNQSRIDSINGGSFVAGGRDVNIQNHYHVAPLPLDMTAKMLEVIKWLNAVNFRIIQSDTFRKHVTGTGAWLLEDDAFRRWLEAEIKVFWVTGIPGAGKTILTSMVINYLQTKVAPRSNILVLFVYCRHDGNLTARAILCAFMRQIADAPNTHPAVQQQLAAFYDRHRLQATTPDVADFTTLFEDVFMHYEHVAASIDALDEVDDEVKEELLEALSGLKVNLFVTSRPSGDSFKATLDDVHSVKLQDVSAARGDIERYIRAKMSSIQRLRSILATGGADTVESVCRALVDKSAGMFLLCALHIEALRRTTNLSELWEKLKHLPADLMAMYRVTWSRIKALAPQEFDLARRTFLWVIYNRSPVLLDALGICEALAVCNKTQSITCQAAPSLDIVESVCAGLVTILTQGPDYQGDNARHWIRLTHYTTYDFFKLEDIAQELSTAPQAEIALSSAIRASVPSGPPSPAALVFPTCSVFERYSIMRWGLHALDAFSSPSGVHAMECGRLCLQSIGVRIDVSRTVRDKDTGKPVLPHRFQRALDIGSLAHGAAYFGIQAYVTDILANQYQPSQFGFFPMHFLANGSGYMFVALVHSVNLLKDLLAGGIDVNVATAEDGFTPLMLAVLRGKHSIVDLLCRHPGIDIEKKSSSGQTALYFAGYSRQITTLRALPRLLGEGADVKTRDVLGQTPFHAWLRLVPRAPLCQHGMGTWLQHPDLDINAQDEEGRTPLMVLCDRLGGAGGGNQEVVQTGTAQLRKRADLDLSLRDREGLNVFERVERKGWRLDEELVPWLMESNVSPN